MAVSPHEVRSYKLIATEIPTPQVFYIASLPVIADKKMELKRAAFPKGWCTSYVASKRAVTWRGNAGMWATNAANQGYSIGPEPQVGAIYVSRVENSRGCPKCGHVAYVEQVEETRFQVSEMNYVAFGKVSYRWIDKGGSFTFIY
jgi:surface antigen